VLSETFALVEPGPLAQQIGCELARICLQVGQPSQAVSVCTQLLDHAAGADRKEIQTLLAEAYREQKDYGRAVSALLDPQTKRSDPAQSPASSKGG